MITFDAKILADSKNPEGVRLTTMSLTYPRCIHSEVMTHRLFSRNAASSRAIPMSKLIQQVKDSPFVPLHWGQNQKGMQAETEMSPKDIGLARFNWLVARDQAVATAELLNELGLHKQIGNRLIEPFMWITIVVSATNWENFFHLRCHKDAEPHIQKIAYMARDLYDANTPDYKEWGEWHLPLFGFPGDEDLPYTAAPKLSIARCARVSYLTHDGRRDTSADIELHDRLAASGHWSPFEHAAQATQTGGHNDVHACSNFHPSWLQYRKFFSQECIKVRQHVDGN
jgi:hypothetical protein